MGLMEDLGAGNLGVDTAIFIYFIEEHPQFLPVILPLFQEADQDKRELITSALTLLEVLVVPYRAGNRILAEQYEVLLTRSRGATARGHKREDARCASTRGRHERGVHDIRHERSAPASNSRSAARGTLVVREMTGRNGWFRNKLGMAVIVLRKNPVLSKNSIGPSETTVWFTVGQPQGNFRWWMTRLVRLI